MVVTHSQGALSEMIVSGRNLNGQISLSFVKVDVSANLITQTYEDTQCGNKKNGVKLPGWRCWKVRKPRGFNTGEIEVIR